eukprot:COSAG02_NODE_104_length_36421_cov_132.465420_9_plen_99_part_00
MERDAPAPRGSESIATGRSTRHVGQSCGWVYPFGQVGECAAGLVCECAGPCSAGALDAPFTCRDPAVLTPRIFVPAMMGLVVVVVVCRRWLRQRYPRW